MALNANAMLDLATTKAYLGIPTANTQSDVRLEIYINAASQRIESFTDRKLIEQTVVELQHGSRSNILLLREYPVTAITELRIDPEHVFTDASTLIPSTDYGIGDGENSLVYYKGSFGKGYNTVRVTYTAGFPLATLPSDLQLAALWYVSWYYNQQKDGDIGRSSKSKGDESVSILNKTPKQIMEILLDYKRTEAPDSNLPPGFA